MMLILTGSTVLYLFLSISTGVAGVVIMFLMVCGFITEFGVGVTLFKTE
jgi:hypothetical protein